LPGKGKCDNRKKEKGIDGREKNKCCRAAVERIRAKGKNEVLRKERRATVLR
jgi:hypothetical protein